MKFSLKTLAAAAVMAVAATGASAAIDNGAGGNGELFFNIWDTNGSYSRDLKISIDSFEALVSTPAAFHLTFSADNLMTSFFDGSSGAGARTGAFKFNVVANDASGARRLLNTYNELTLPTARSTASAIRTATGTEINFITELNKAAVLGVNDSAAVDKNSPAFAGKATFKDTVGGGINFSNAGGVANDSFASGLSFLRIDAAASGAAALPSVYNQYVGTSEVHVYFDANKTLHIESMAAAVPEPESYAMLLAGLGMIGFMARRRQNNRV